MTEAEWLACDQLPWMLHFVGGRTSVRKLRLFACGCCRQIWGLLGPAARAAVEAMEAFADGGASRAQVDAARAAALAEATHLLSDDQDSTIMPRGHPGVAIAYPRATSPVRFVVMATHAADLADRAARGSSPVCAGQPALARCVFGNLFHQPAGDPWRPSAAVRGVGRGIYEARAFDHLPILADALQDAGCEDEAMLAHCRSPGPHVRGCWAVDLVLGLG